MHPPSGPHPRLSVPADIAPETAAYELGHTVKDLGFCGVLVNDATEWTAQRGQPLWLRPPAKPILQQHSELHDTMATNTLDAVRQRLAAEEPELRRRGVRHLAVFGSVARGDDRPGSDIDVAVEIEAGRSFSLNRMEETRLLLEDALRRPVDLGEVDSFRPQVRAAFERERIPIF
jgi:hypothetical protein